ncbi:protein FAM227B-like isoform X3 [Mytilus trossulus]|uniref:protein FAM227B-like isoform X3 n=1 Tax=Mytilus trossulus TaxID=6551 RepID=UPI003007C295
MAVVLDPKVAAIMAKVEEEEMEEAARKKAKPKVKAPTNIEEFLAAEKLDDWPYPMATEGPLDLENEALLLGSQDDIAAIIRDSAPIGLHMMEDLESDLEDLEKKLKFYADQILAEDDQETKKVERLPFSSARTFMTEMTDSDAVKTHHSAKVPKSLDFAESMLETRKRTIEFCQFPGFRHGELVELPAQIESLPILHKITKAQDFNPGFKKFWKKLFLSEASVAVLQDTFWWIFLNKFDEGRNTTDNKSLLYDRIADSYVALFTSIHNDVKDKFLGVYPNCLAQAVYLIYRQAFPESSNKLADEFKQELCNTVFEWITGIKAPGQIFNKWDVKKIETDSAKGKKADKQVSETTQKIMQAAALNKEVSASLDMESFHKVIDNLGSGGQGSVSSARQTPQGASREITKMTNFSLPTNGTVTSQQGMYNTFSRTSPSRLATCGSTVRRKFAQQIDAYLNDTSTESHQIGPGPEYERVMFNVQGRSPLISHYLHMRQLRDFHQPGKKIRRTEISALPPEGPTYRQLIQKSIAMSEAIQREYQKICEETDQEIYELKRRQRESNIEFNKLSKELMMTKNPLDLKILSDKILELYSDFPDSKDNDQLVLYKEKERDAILLDTDTDPAQSVAGADDEDT